MQAEFTFTGEPLTVNFFEETVEMEVLNLLADVTAEVRNSVSDGCSIDVQVVARTPSKSAECDVSIFLDEIITERNASAVAGAHRSVLRSVR